MAVDARVHVRAPGGPVAAVSQARAAIGASAACRTIEVAGVRLAVDDDGAGEPVVCLHAIAHGAGDYAGFRARHRDRFRVLAVDWPGHGRSGDDRIAPSSARYGDLLARLLDVAALDRVILIGNSIGGGAALRVAAARPDRVRGVIAANSAGLVADGLPKRLVTRAMASFFGRGARDARWFPRAYAVLYRSILRRPAAAEQRVRIVAAGREMAPLLEQAWRSFGQPADDLSHVLPDVGCPVLVTWSVGDRLNPLAFNRAGIARLPHGRLETFPGGHAPFLECPQAFDAAFARFVAGLA
jgi:4,5:9,10-diseco-3-hydroxy-5,9,17-trioxoandrosta-1(10),2-diene-4-oate hydrolase